MKKTCPKCGRECDDFKFCPDCGTELKEKSKAQTIEEEVDIWLRNPENMKKYQEACEYFADFRRSLEKKDAPATTSGDPITAFELEAKRAAESASAAKSKSEDSALATFYYKENSDGTVTITGLKDTSITEVRLPDNAIAIGEYAFASCANIKSVNISYKVTSIGECAFFNCTSLTSINIPNRVNSIGKSAFSHCTALTSIYLPDSITSIGANAFSNCSKLTSIHIPNGVTSIGESAFFGCGNLITVYVPSGATYIGRDVFLGCDKIKSAYIERGNVLGGGLIRLDDDSIIDKLGLPYECRIIKK